MPNRTKEPPVLTPDDIAADLGFTRQTAIRMCRDGEIPAFKIRNRWRITADTYDQWKRAREIGLTIERADQ